MVANTDAGDEVLETAWTVVLKNLGRVLGMNGKYMLRRLCLWAPCAGTGHLKEKNNML
ncbi:hypothetical protein [Klebsiella variicola]|uniref:hypothetical protein n=1 Tax=Klebsiella variicola TaxID=244366 RepID=UPI001E586003|nr:hypothetical protein [Klebsiella variicola]HCI8565123.1 hypothetical protein [Klebsiella variicola]